MPVSDSAEKKGGGLQEGRRMCTIGTLQSKDKEFYGEVISLQS